jgi:predicted ArsR family transcriptional regulator
MAFQQTAGSTSEALYRAIVEADAPVVTRGDLAEKLDVSIPTVTKHIESVEHREDIRVRKIGQSFTYWYEEPEEAQPVYDFEYTTDLGVQSPEKLAIEARAEYLHATQLAEAYLHRGEANAKVRHWYWRQLNRYLNRSQLSQAVEKADSNGFALREDSNFGQFWGDRAEYHATERHFFTSSWCGEVEGIVGLKEFESKREARLLKVACGGDIPDPADYTGEDTDVMPEPDLSKITAQDLDETYPSLATLMGVGNQLDNLVTEASGIRW